MQVDSFIEQLNGEQEKIMLLLRSEIHASIPQVQEKLAYGIPFFYFMGPMVYLSPKRNGVEVGFSKGYLFRHGLEYLDDKNRKQVRSFFLSSIQDYKPELFLMLLYEAMDINRINRGLH